MRYIFSKPAILNYSFLLLILANFSGFTIAQIPGSIDPNFIPTESNLPNELRSDVIYKVLEQPDGKILVGGAIALFRGQVTNGLVRLNADLTDDISFEADHSANGIVRIIALQQDGKILIGGQFDTYRGIASKNIVRLMPNGTVDASFNVGLGADGMVTAISVLGNGQIMVGGQFTSFNGLQAGRMVRLNSDGSVDTTLDTSGLFDNSPNVILQQGDKWVVAGDMTLCRSATIGRIARINPDGSCDNTFQADTGSSGTIYDMIFDQQGRIVITGFINSFNGQNASHITRLSADGVVDMPFQSSTRLNAYARSLSLRNDGTITVMGLFTRFNNQEIGHAVNINEDGANTNAISEILGFRFSPFTYCQLSNGNIVVASGFSYYRDVNVYAIGVFSNNGEIVHRNIHSSGFNGSIQVSKALNDGRILVGGFFNFFNGERIGYSMARLQPDGSLDHTFDIGDGFDSLVQDVEIQPDGKLIVAGFFSEFDGKPSRSIVRLMPDGAYDPTFQIGSGFNNTVYDVEVLDDGKILAVGSFITYNGMEANRIIRLNTDGSRDDTFQSGSGFNLNVHKISIQEDGKILLAGLFTAYQNQSYSRIIRLHADGTIDTSFDPGTGADAIIYTMLDDRNGHIYIGGNFRNFDGVEVNRFARLFADGSIDPSFDIGTGFDASVFSMDADRMGRLIVGGLFKKYNNMNAKTLARLHPDGSLDSEFMSGLGMDEDDFQGLYDEVTSIMTLESGDFLVVGYFQRIGKYPRSTFAKILYGVPTNLEQDWRSSPLPSSFSIEPNFPNPFNPSTTLRVELPVASNLEVTVYDLTGRKVMQLPARSLQAGRHNISLDASRLSSGVYVYRISTGTWAASGKMTLVK